MLVPLQPSRHLSSPRSITWGGAVSLSEAPKKRNLFLHQQRLLHRLSLSSGVPMSRGLAYHRHQALRARNRARRVLRAQKIYAPSARLVSRLATDRKPCSCYLCSYTLDCSTTYAMRKAALNAREQLDDLS